MLCELYRYLLYFIANISVFLLFEKNCLNKKIKCRLRCESHKYSSRVRVGIYEPALLQILVIVLFSSTSWLSRLRFCHLVLPCDLSYSRFIMLLLKAHVDLC